MKRDMTGGLALILGSVCLLVTMAFHPAAGGVEGLVRESTTRIWTHSLGLAAIPVLLYGFVGLFRRLEADEFSAPAAFVVQSFGYAAGMCAAVLNGLAAPAFAARVAARAATDPAAQDTARTVLAYSFLLNASFAKVMMAALAAAMALWSLAILRTRAFGPGVAWLGIVLGAAGLVGVLGGFMGASIHEFAMFVFGMSIWTVWVGALLCRSRATPAARN